jgi:hypothetical protein
MPSGSSFPIPCGEIAGMIILILKVCHQVTVLDDHAEDYYNLKILGSGTS